MPLLKSCSLIYECGIKLVYKRLKDFSLHLFCVVNINWQQNWRSFIFIAGQISRTETWSNLEVKSWKDRIVFVFFFLLYKPAKQCLSLILDFSQTPDLMRRSIRKFNIPPRATPRATPRAFELLKIGLFKFPPLGTKKPFKCPTN